MNDNFVFLKEFDYYYILKVSVNVTISMNKESGWINVILEIEIQLF